MDGAFIERRNTDPSAAVIPDDLWPCSLCEVASEATTKRHRIHSLSVGCSLQDCSMPTKARYESRVLNDGMRSGRLSPRGICLRNVSGYSVVPI